VNRSGRQGDRGVQGEGNADNAGVTGFGINNFEFSVVSLDDFAWALGIESSKTAEVEGSKVFDLYQAGKLDQIREYNLNDVRVTRKIYERMVASFGR